MTALCLETLGWYVAHYKIQIYLFIFRVSKNTVQCKTVLKLAPLKHWNWDTMMYSGIVVMHSGIILNPSLAVPFLSLHYHDYKLSDCIYKQHTCTKNLNQANDHLGCITIMTNITSRESWNHNPNALLMTFTTPLVVKILPGNLIKIIPEHPFNKQLSALGLLLILTPRQMRWGAPS